MLGSGAWLMGGQLGSGLTLGMWGKSCGVLLCPRDGEGTKGCAKAPISSGALLVQAGPGIAGCRARSRFVGKAFQNFVGCNFCSPSESLYSLSCANEEIWLFKWERLEKSTSKNRKALQVLKNSASVKDMSLYAGEEYNKDFY